jgi:Mrp family chromosome partitioning ATPase
LSVHLTEAANMPVDQFGTAYCLETAVREVGHCRINPFRAVTRDEAREALADLATLSQCGSKGAVMSAAPRQLPRMKLVNDGPQTDRPKNRHARAAAAAPRPVRRGTPGVRGIISILRRRIPTFLVTFASIVCLGLAFLALQVPVYRATSEIVPAATGGDRTQAAIASLRSPTMAGEVAAALRLDRDASFLRGAGAGSPIDRARALSGLDRGSAPPLGSAAARNRATQLLTASASVTRPADTVSLLIAATAPTPDLAARIANEYARQYARQELARPEAQGSGARILAEAEPPLSPINPSPLPILLGTIALGLILGLLAAILREKRFRGITSGGEVEARTGLHHLGTVPLVATVLKDATSPAQAIVDSPRSGFAEAFRSLRTSIRIAGGEQVQVVAITSASSGDGKSVVAACLARTIALSGDSVVLIDCASGTGGAIAMLDVAVGPSLADVASGAATLDSALVHDATTGAFVVPLGDGVDPQSLVPILAALRAQFAHILIDAPAVRGSAGAAMSVPADLFVIVARWRATPDRAVRQVAAALRAQGATVGGVALAQVDMKRQVKFVHDDESNYYAKLSKYYS